MIFKPRPEGAGEAVVGDINFMDANDAFYKNALKRMDIDPNGSFDVIAHELQMVFS